VIVAVPLGCLKAGAIAFAPPLPDWKQDAIAALGYGNLNKVPFEKILGFSDGLPPPLPDCEQHLLRPRQWQP
jgi:hypothetical protein